MSLLFKLFKQPRLNDQLRTAVGKRDASAIKVLIGQGASVNQNHDIYDRSLLSHAVKKNDVETVKALLTGQPDLETQGLDDDMTPLAKAITKNRIEIARLLLSHGANPISASLLDERLSALLIALKHEDQDLTEFVLNHVRDMGFESNHDLSCLELAVMKSRADNVLLLLSKCPNEDRRYMLSKVWMGIAALNGRESVVRAFLDSGVHINVGVDFRKEGGPDIVEQLNAKGHSTIATLFRERHASMAPGEAAANSGESDRTNLELDGQESGPLATDLFFDRMSTHRDRIEQASPEHIPFTANHFDNEMLQTLAGLAADKMNLTNTDASVHSISISGNDVAYAVYTMPLNLAEAGQWYANEYGGYMPFLNRMAEVPAISNSDPKLLVHLVFGQAPSDDDLWFTMTVLPVDQNQYRFQPLLATDLLTQTEMAELSSKLNAH